MKAGRGILSECGPLVSLAGRRQDGQMGRPHGDLRRRVKSVQALIAKAAAVKVQITFRRVDLMCVTSVLRR